MQSNKSSRRGFFGKTLAFLGAAFACSTTTGPFDAALAAASRDATKRSGNDSENRFTCYFDGPVTKTERFFYEVDDDGNVNLIEYHDSP